MRPIAFIPLPALAHLKKGALLRLAERLQERANSAEKIFEKTLAEGMASAIFSLHFRQKRKMAAFWRDR
jgi:hypothetical protein